MATPKKKHLIELMIEAGVKWPDGAEYAAQDKHTLRVNFYRNGKPNFQSGCHEWLANDCAFMADYGAELDSICRNWHQTIVTLEQYSEALAANVGEPSSMASQSNQARESEDIPASQPSAEYCVSVMRQMPDNTIEQLAEDYHAKATEADRLQVVADEALKAADDALIALEKAGELIGLIISIDAKPNPVDQLEITDWRDLRIGDVIEYKSGTVDSRIGMEGVVEEIDIDDADFQIRVMIDGELWWCNKFRFIRRP